MTLVGLRAALRSPLVFAKSMIARLNRRALNAKALVRITSHGGHIAVSYPADGRTLPVLLGVNGSQMFDPEARIHIWLPALSDTQWSELKPCLQSLATIVSLQIAGGNAIGADFGAFTTAMNSATSATTAPSAIAEVQREHGNQAQLLADTRTT